MQTLFEKTLDTGLVARVQMTDRSDGDLSSNQPLATVEDRRRTVKPGAWTWLRQVHGADVVTVGSPGEHAGAEADAAVTETPGAILAVQVADCVPVAILASNGPVGVAHAGWKGLAAGVVEATATAILSMGGKNLTAVVGPCIGTECYEFGADELAELVDRWGPGVQGVTADETPALNMKAAIEVVLQRLNITDIVWAAPCTSCEADRFWSWRARTDAQRQAMLLEIEPA